MFSIINKNVASINFRVKRWNLLINHNQAWNVLLHKIYSYLISKMMTLQMRM